MTAKRAPTASVCLNRTAVGAAIHVAEVYDVAAGDLSLPGRID